MGARKGLDPALRVLQDQARTRRTTRERQTLAARMEPIQSAAQQYVATQGRQAQRISADPTTRRRHLQALADSMIRQSGIPKRKRMGVEVTLGSTGPARLEVEGDPSTLYQPTAYADQVQRHIRMNDADVGVNPSLESDPARAHFREYQQQRVMAHEVGHELEPLMIRNYARARAYTDAKGIPLDPRAPILNRSIAGRAERNVGNPVKRDYWGMATEGPKGTHSAPNELYAEDVMTALGYQGVSERQRAVLRELARRKLIPPLRPKVSPKGLPSFPWPVRETDR